MQSSKLGMYTILSTIEGIMKGVPLLPRIVYTRRLGGWTFGWSLPVLNFFEYLSVYYHHKVHPCHILV